MFAQWSPDVFMRILSALRASLRFASRSAVASRGAAAAASSSDEAPSADDPSSSSGKGCATARRSASVASSRSARARAASSASKTLIFERAGGAEGEPCGREAKIPFGGGRDFSQSPPAGTSFSGGTGVRVSLGSLEESLGLEEFTLKPPSASARGPLGVPVTSDPSGCRWHTGR